MRKKYGLSYKVLLQIEFIKNIDCEYIFWINNQNMKMNLF